MGIGGDDPQWLSVHHQGLSRADLLGIVRTELSREYTVLRSDAFDGELETDWEYGAFSRVRRQDVRQRVLVEVESDDGELELRLRVQQEINEQPGRQLNHATADWMPHDDDVTKAKVLIRRISHVLESVGGDAMAG